MDPLEEVVQLEHEGGVVAKEPRGCAAGDALHRCDERVLRAHVVQHPEPLPRVYQILLSPHCWMLI
jgi:hypothetical protein